MRSPFSSKDSSKLQFYSKSYHFQKVTILQQKLQFCKVIISQKLRFYKKPITCLKTDRNIHILKRITDCANRHCDWLFLVLTSSVWFSLKLDLVMLKISGSSLFFWSFDLLLSALGIHTISPSAEGHYRRSGGRGTSQTREEEDQEREEGRSQSRRRGGR